MDFNRNVDQGGLSVAKQRVSFCLSQIEKAGGFSKGIKMETELVPKCTVEEIVGALVAAEQQLER